MIYQPQHSKATFIAKFSAAIMLSIFLICSPSLLHAESSKKTSNDVNLEKLKTQLLEDPVFLSKLKEKIAPYINDHDIQEVVKNYLLTNPEIMIQMQFVLQKKLEKLEEQRTQKQSSIINSLKKEIFQSPHDIILGNPNGKIVLVDFFDYNCKFCKSSYHHIESLIKEYPNLRVIVKDLPILGHDSTAAHTVAYAFRKQLPEKYPQFYKALLTNQGRANKATAIKIAVSLGADEKKLRNAIKDPTLLNSFKENIQIASALNITGTPSYIIGDKVLIGAVNKNILKELIENIQ
ncbi:DsbA family protein [Bartonella sp. CB74]|uniref:DsbA family protein n=1 Tax=Bartonella sp. CB74 TaxID=3113620 RepID=UPI002F967A67